MHDARPLVISLLLAMPFACSHEGPDPKNASQGMAGSSAEPAPSTTEEPVVPGVPQAVNGWRPAATDMRPAFDASRTLVASNGIAQPVPPHGTGGTVGSGGTLGTGGTGTGGTGTGGIGPGAGTGGISTGGTSIH